MDLKIIKWASPPFQWLPIFNIMGMKIIAGVMKPPATLEQLYLELFIH